MLDTVAQRKERIRWLTNLSADIDRLVAVTKPAGTPMTAMSIVLVTNCMNLCAVIEGEIARIRRLRAGTRKKGRRK